MTQPNAYEQLILELINRERAKSGGPPLASNGDLNEAAGAHSSWMIGADVFSHTGQGGSSAGQRMAVSGYALSGSWTWGENIAYASLRDPAGLQDEARLLHSNLMNSSGHRANILNPAFREIGIGFEVGEYGGRQNAFITENFAKSGSDVFLTGVAYRDGDRDGSYDATEGIADLTVTATNTAGATFRTTTMDAGGYNLALGPGSYKVAISGLGATGFTRSVAIGTQNVKFDIVDPAVSSSGDPVVSTPVPLLVVSGTVGNDTLIGGADPELLDGQAGADRLFAHGGDDTLAGGLGNDLLAGGAGQDRLSGQQGSDALSGGPGRDVLTGGGGADAFVFAEAVGAAVDSITDFAPVYDRIQIENAVFSGLPLTGVLASSAFYSGRAAHDASDRIIYDTQTGNLLHDPDGVGGAAGARIATLSPWLAVTNADFVVV